MSQERLTMRSFQEVLRLKFELGHSNGTIAKILGISKTTVSTYLSRAKKAGVAYPLGPEISHSAVFAKLFAPEPSSVPLSKPLPDFALIHLELKRKGVTLLLLWDEYRAVHPDGYAYTQFCHYYKQWKGKLRLSMRQDHKAGEKMFVDYSGGKLEIIDPQTGEIKEAEMFVAVLGASGYTFAEASLSQDSPSWIASHIRAFEFFGGITEILVPDNLKSGVTKPCRYEPLINQSYHDMARHYGAVVIPARVQKPKDKAKAEIGVCLVTRWILAVLRNRRFFSLAEANEAISGLLVKLNGRSMQKIKKSRKELFETIDCPALKPLLASAYTFAEFAVVRVNIDYHIEVDEHYYSVPYALQGKQVEVRLAETTVEVFFDGKRVASHRRSHHKYAPTTLPEHMPEAHKRYAEWTPSRLINWGASLCPEAGQLFEAIMKGRPHPEQGFRSCLGIVGLEKKYGKDRLTLACRRALVLRAYSYQTLKKMLENKVENTPVPQMDLPLLSEPHENLRGASYFTGETSS